MESVSLVPTRAYFSGERGAPGHMLPPPLCAGGSRLALPCAELSPGAAGACQRVLGWKGPGAVEREVRASAFSPHSGGGVQSSGWAVLAAAEAAAAADWAPEPCTPQPGMRGWPGRKRRGVKQPGEVPGPQSCAGNLSWKSLLFSLDTLSGGGGQRRKVADRTASLPPSVVAVTAGEHK